MKFLKESAHVSLNFKELEQITETNFDLKS